jgi:uncharacterized UBP type Zn finger protein
MFKNAGNTCFLNVCLHVLLRMCRVRAELKEHNETTENGSSDCLKCCLKMLLEESADEPKVIEPTHILNFLLSKETDQNCIRFYM